jgi:hypothetical protein
MILAYILSFLLVLLSSIDLSHGYSVVRKRLTIQRPASCSRKGCSFLTSSSSASIAEEGSSPHQDRDGGPASGQGAIEEATNVLSEWDRLYNTKNDDDDATVAKRAALRPRLVAATLVLNEAARLERERQIDLGRCMLGICASSTAEGIATLKAWVTALRLPRGLLHGMDVDGVPIEMTQGVYIKYNSGGVYTFADIRKSQMGFDALWKPGMFVVCWSPSFCVWTPKSHDGSRLSHNLAVVSHTQAMPCWKNTKENIGASTSRSSFPTVSSASSFCHWIHSRTSRRSTISVGFPSASKHDVTTVLLCSLFLAGRVTCCYRWATLAHIVCSHQLVYSSPIGGDHVHDDPVPLCCRANGAVGLLVAHNPSNAGTVQGGETALAGWHRNVRGAPVQGNAAADGLANGVYLRVNVTPILTVQRHIVGDAHNTVQQRLTAGIVWR